MLAFLLLLHHPALDFVPLPPAVSDVVDAATGMKRTIRIDSFEIDRDETGRNATWFEAIRFANAYSVQKKLEPCYNAATGQRIRLDCRGYRLPTEAEWSHAFHNRQREGIRDLEGGVWEWCEDWFGPNSSPWPLDNPRGPLRGLNRVIRGGSALTKPGPFSRGLRSSLDPHTRSPHTGFRLVRSTGRKAPDPEAPTLDPAPVTNAQAPVEPLSAKPSLAAWIARLGKQPNRIPSPPRVRLVRNVQTAYYDARILDYESEPGVWERFAIVDPDAASAKPKPVVIVPYYDVDTPLGAELGGRTFNPIPAVWFARHAAQMGFLAVAVRWFGESDGERYDEVVANLRQRHPGLTGLGKWVWDSRRLIDYIETLPGVDKSRIGMIGHSLGGKMTLYAAATDDRIRAAVSSEPGLAFRFSNYGDPWYWGDRLPVDADQHELVGLIAPRSYLLIAGEDSDGDKSWPYLDAARGLFREASGLGWINHRTGHTPSLDATARAMDWLRAKLLSR